MDDPWHIGRRRVTTPQDVDVDVESEHGWDLLSEMTHEIGNMLTAVSGWAQFWEETDASAAKGHVPARYLYIGLARIRYSLDRVVPRVRGAATDMLSEAKDGMLRARSNEFTEVNVNQLVETTLAALDPRVGAGYRLETNLEPAPWPIMASYWALEIVLMNLLMDAATVSPSGGRIVVGTANAEKHEPLVGLDGVRPPGRYVVISVRDAEDQANKGWLECQPGLATRARYPQNRLRICRAILQEHEGVLQVSRSASGEETSLVYLPACFTRPDARTNPVQSVETATKCCQ